MTEEQIAVAKRVVACKGWKWLPGMKGMYLAESVAVRVHGVGVGSDAYCDAFALHSCKRFNVPVSRLRDPDLSDPATLGCLLALVREATTAYASLTFEPGYLHTEVENLVAALEAAP
jgi:hypothetical protein